MARLGIEPGYQTSNLRVRCPTDCSTWPSLIQCYNVFKMYTVIILNIGTDRSEQTVQTQIRLLLMEQSDQGLLCLLFCLHHCTVKSNCSNCRTIMVIISGVPIFRIFTVGTSPNPIFQLYKGDNFCDSFLLHWLIKPSKMTLLPLERIWSLRDL